jgi:hypothetical protein
VLLAAGVPCVVALFGVQGWRWDWVRGVSDLVFDVSTLFRTENLMSF